MQEADATAVSIKTVADHVSAVIAAGTVLGALPYLAAGASLIWYLIRFWEYGREKYRERHAGKKP